MFQCSIISIVDIQSPERLLVFLKDLWLAHNGWRVYSPQNESHCGNFSYHASLEATCLSTANEFRTTRFKASFVYELKWIFRVLNIYGVGAARVMRLFSSWKNDLKSSSLLPSGPHPVTFPARWKPQRGFSALISLLLNWHVLPPGRSWRKVYCPSVLWISDKTLVSN